MPSSKVAVVEAEKVKKELQEALRQNREARYRTRQAARALRTVLDQVLNTPVKKPA